MADILLQNKNLLITSVGAKVPLIQAIKEQLEDTGVNIVLADSDKDCLASNLNFDFWKMPSLKDLSANDLISFCKSKNIRFILPTRNGELVYFSKIKGELEKEGIFAMVSDIEPLKIALDKLLYYQKLSSLGLNVIKTTIDINDLGDVERFAVKDRFGAGSIGLKCDVSKEIALEYSKKLENPIFQPYIEGVEYSADCFSDFQRGIVEVLIRKRIMVKNGEAQITECVEDDYLKNKIIELLKALNIYGHSVSQFFLTKNNEVFIIETNPRVGGATPLAFKCGLESIKWFIYSNLGYEVPKNNRYLNLKMVRVAKDLFYDTHI